MLLQAKNPLLRRSGAAGITFVGAASDGGTVNGGIPSIDLTTIALAQNDIVVTCCGTSGGTVATPSGWTLIQNDSSVGGSVWQAGTFYKIMGASPDTSVSFWDSGATSESGAAIAFAFRGVDTTTPMDTTATETEAGAGSSPDAVAITPTNNNTCIVIMAVSSVLDADPGTVTNYTQPSVHVDTGNDNNDTTVAGAYRILVGGGGASEDPAAWSTWTNATWWCVTIALRPAT